MFEFGLPWLLLLIPAPLALLFFKRKERSAQRIYFPGIQKRLPELKVQQPTLWWRYILPLLIWALTVSAAAQPRWLGSPIPLATEAREVMIALDMSGSMQMDDMTMNGQRVSRLYAAHHILADFIRRREGDRIGLVLYGDSAHLYVPVTSDLETVATLAEEAQFGLVGERTALGDAVGLAIRYFTEREATERVVIMLSDGMINAGSLSGEDALFLAKNNNVKIHTIGIGADEVVVPGIFGDRRINPSQDLDEVFLSQLAQATRGEYFRARNTNEMEQIYRIIDELEPILDDKQHFRPQLSLAHWPLLLSLLLISLFSIARVLLTKRTAQRLAPEPEGKP